MTLFYLTTYKSNITFKFVRPFLSVSIKYVVAGKVVNSEGNLCLGIAYKVAACLVRIP